MTNKDEYVLLRVITQQERSQIIMSLLSGTKNISELADVTHLDRATVSYHLGVLEHNDLVKSDYKMLQEPHSKGKIGRYYVVDSEKLGVALESVKKFIQMTESKSSTG